MIRFFTSDYFLILNKNLLKTAHNDEAFLDK